MQTERRTPSFFQLFFQTHLTESSQIFQKNSPEMLDKNRVKVDKSDKLEVESSPVISRKYLLTGFCSRCLQDRIPEKFWLFRSRSNSVWKATFETKGFSMALEKIATDSAESAYNPHRLKFYMIPIFVDSNKSTLI